MPVAESSRWSMVGNGIYSLSEASRLLRTPRGKVRRWLRGYQYRTRTGEQRQLAPVVGTGLSEVEGVPFLTFHDLMELRFVETFLEAGVRMPVIRLASHEAVELLETRHLFQSQVFRTDGRRIIADLMSRSGEVQLLSLVSQQYELMAVTTTTLINDVEFDPDDPSKGITRWLPLGPEGGIVVDPQLRFGAPVVEGAYLPTYTLAAFALAESIEAATNWYGVTADQVRYAIRFESWLRGGDVRTS